jgi:hypothetical protein
MKQRSHNNKNTGSHAAADLIQKASKSAPNYQIDDRRATSVMQRKFRNLANGLASANIIQQKDDRRIRQAQNASIQPGPQKKA